MPKEKEFLCDQGNCLESGDKKRAWIVVSTSDECARLCSYTCLKLWAESREKAGVKP